LKHISIENRAAAQSIINNSGNFGNHIPRISVLIDRDASRYNLLTLPAKWVRKYHASHLIATTQLQGTR